MFGKEIVSIIKNSQESAPLEVKFSLCEINLTLHYSSSYREQNITNPPSFVMFVPFGISLVSFFCNKLIWSCFRRIILYRFKSVVFLLLIS